MILLVLMNLHEIQMPATWQIEYFIPIYNAVHDARIVRQFGKTYEFVHLYECHLAHLYIWCNLYIKIIHKNV